jgi:putative acetyltransferase
MTIRAADFANPQLLALLRLHLAGMQEHSPPDMVHALDLSGLQVPEINFWTLWEGEVLLGFGALKSLGDGTGEIKSMRTDPHRLRKGVAARLLDHIIAEANARQYTRLSLETGSGKAFEPALALYRQYGFANGAPFGDYAASDFNQFLHLALV